MNTELVEFTRQALARGIPRETVAATLTEAGWDGRDIATALKSFAEIEFPLPVPRPRPYLSPREVLTYLVLFVALYDSVYNLCSITFEFINRHFPDPLQHVPAAYSNDAIRWNLASLIVAFPLFLLMFHKVNAATARDPTKRGSRPRKWLTSLTLFIASIVMVGDGITLINEALGGELTVRIVLKVMTVAAVAGGTFAYFLWDLRKEEKA
jgi:hypothetical protein